VRDGTYSVVALARMGHFAEAKLALDFFLNAFDANPVGFKDGKYKSYVNNTPYRISVVRYYGTGEEEADWNQDGPNVETDGWGLVLWAARQYIEASGDVAWLDSPTFNGTVWDALTAGIAGPIEAQLEVNGIMRADSSIWEVHDAKKRHYAFTTLTAARGLCDMAGIAKKANKGDPTKYTNLAKKVRDGFLASFVDPQGALAGSIEGLGQGKYTDGAVAEAFTWNVLQDWKGATATATLDLLNKLRVDSGGYKRNDDGLSSYDNNEWILVDLRIANALRRAGRGGEADGIIAHVVQKAAANFYLVPELYNDTASAGATGIYTGSIPMVGYGGGAFVMTMLDRAGISEPNDCGDGKGATLPKLDCGGISTNPGGPGGPGGDGGAGAGPGGVPDGSQVPFVGACLCNLIATDRGIPPLGILLFIAAPALLLARRVKRRPRA
jgi:GH15 family glucan-1,4-alpha-glucosidase